MRQLSGSRKIFALGSLILGVLLLIWPGSALRTAAYATGIVVMAGGIASILAHFRGRGRRLAGPLFSGFNLLMGIIVTLVGGWIFTNPEDFASIIPTALGYLIVISGIINLLETFSLSRARYKKWWVSLLAAVVTICMGLLLINHAFGIALTMVRLAGIFLLFNGISDIVILRRVDQYVRYGKKRSARRKSARAGGTDTGSAKFDTSDPDIIDAENYREM